MQFDGTTQSPEIDPDTYGRLILTKVPTWQFDGEMKIFSTNWARTTQ